jgi:hypothetical protein
MGKEISYHIYTGFKEYIQGEILKNIGINDYEFSDTYFISNIIEDIKTKFNCLNHYKSTTDYENNSIKSIDELDIYDDEDTSDDIILYEINHCLMFSNFAITFEERKMKDNSESEINELKIYYKEEHGIDTVIKYIKEYRIKLDNNSNTFYTIGTRNGHYFLEKNNIKKFDYNIDINYGSNFKEHNDNVLLQLQKTYGLLLFYGDPGCGKTMYIRYLINQFSDKKNVIYLPSYMIEYLSNPELISFIKRYKNTLLILEDAEHALLDRSVSHSSAVSNLLNITCGLLNDITEIQIIATFNTNKSNIDKALLREGRLLYEYKFDKLSIEDSLIVAKHLNIDIEITEPMTLAQIYNYADFITNKNNNTSSKKIGFQR